MMVRHGRPFAPDPDGRAGPMKWTPPRGCAYSGGDMTVAVGGRVGVFIKTEKADFDNLFRFGRNDAQVQSEVLLTDFITEWCK